MPAPFEPPK